MRTVAALVLVLQLVSVAFGQCGPAQCYSGCTDARVPLDLIFIIDNSGSMDDKINGVVTGLTQFANDLASKSVIPWYNLITVGDSSDRAVVYLNGESDSTVFKNQMAKLPQVSSGGWEPSLEAIRRAGNTAASGNFNLNLRPGSKRAIILVTDEDSDPAYLGANRFQPSSGDREVCNPTWTPWQNEINAVYSAILNIDASTYFLVNAGTGSSICLTAKQFGDYRNNIQSQSADYKTFDAAKTLTNLRNAGFGDSLQAQLLTNGKLSRVFQVQLATNSTFIKNFFETITTDVSTCDTKCTIYPCSLGACQKPQQICGCDGVPNSGATVDSFGVCCSTPDKKDCTGKCNGTSQYDECGVCGTSRSNLCTKDCKGQWYLTSKPSSIYATPDNLQPNSAGYLLMNSDLYTQFATTSGSLRSIDLLKNYFHTNGRFEGHYSCVFDANRYATQYSVTAGNAESDWLNNLLSTSTPKRQAFCVSNSRVKLPPTTFDFCCQCILSPDNPPQCLLTQPGPNPCKVVCKEQQSEDTIWAASEVNTNATGTCKMGYIGTPIRYCNESGFWSDTVFNPCEVTYCPEEVLSGKTWNQTSSGATVTIDCSNGYEGFIQRTCQGLSGYSQWGNVVDNCTNINECLIGLGKCKENQVCVNTEGSYACICSSGSFINGSTCSLCPESRYQDQIGSNYCKDCPINTVSVFGSSSLSSCTCITGFSISGTECKANTCEEGIFDNIYFPKTLFGKNAVGKCPNRFEGSPLKTCNVNGKWEEGIQGGCTKNFEPTCRDPSQCGNLSKDSCKACYQKGGMLNPSKPDLCYCPTSKTYDSPKTISCGQSNFPLCSGAYFCDSSCGECIGPSSSDCITCSYSYYEMVPNGKNYYGSCKQKCYPEQYRDSNGSCKYPDCSSLFNCFDKGTCKWNGKQSFCSCQDNFEGEDCSTPKSCPELDNCYKKGECTFNRIQRYVYCNCKFGWKGEKCDIPVTLSYSVDNSFTYNSIKHLGSKISIYKENEFRFSDSVECYFENIAGRQKVVGRIEKEYKYFLFIFPVEVIKATCISPPSPSIAKSLKLSIKVNGVLMPFDTVYSEKLDISDSNQILNYEEDYNEMVWTKNSQEYEFNFEINSNFVAEAYRWNWDPFDKNLNKVPKLEYLGVLSSSKTDTYRALISIEPTQFVFDWKNSLVVLSFKQESYFVRKYAIIIPSDLDSTGKCNEWSQNSLDNFNYVDLTVNCKEALKYGYSDVCLNEFPRPVNLKFDCYQSTRRNFKCYRNPEYAITKLFVEPFSSPKDGEVVKHFYTTQLPRILCCHLSDSCNLYGSKRSISFAIKRMNSIEKRLIDTNYIGMIFGNTHVNTFDGTLFTLNLVGEYTLLQSVIPSSHNWTFQVRLDTLDNMKSTYISAFSFNYNSSSTFSVYADEVDKFLFNVNGKYESSTYLNSGESIMIEENVIFSRENQNKFTLIIDENIYFVIQNELGSLWITVSISQNEVGTLTGLLGSQMDGDSSNDLIFRNGTVLTGNLSKQSLIEYGNSWKFENQQESNFFYGNDFNFTYYSNTLINEMYPIEDLLNNTYNNNTLYLPGSEVCKGGYKGFKEKCLIDILVNDGYEYGLIALKLGSLYQEYIIEANTPPIIQSDIIQNEGQMDVYLGQSLVINLSVEDKEGKSVTCFISKETEKIQSTLEQYVDSIKNKVIVNYKFNVTEEMLISNTTTFFVQIKAVDVYGLDSTFSFSFRVLFSTCENLTNLQKEMDLLMKTQCDPNDCTEKCSNTINLVLSYPCSKELKLNNPIIEPTQNSCCLSNSNLIIQCPSKESPTNEPTTTSPPTTNEGKGLSSGGKAGVSIFLIALFLGLICGGLYYYFKIYKVRKVGSNSNPSSKDVELK